MSGSKNYGKIMVKNYCVKNIYTMEFSREKEGAYTLCNGMDGTGEHYAR